MLIYFYLLLAMFFWGLSFVWTKIVFEYYQPLTVVCARLALSGFLLWIATKLLKSEQKVQKKDLPWFFVMAIAEPFLYFIGESYGIMKVSATVASLIIATIPIFNIIVARILGLESFRKSAVIGALFSIFGIVILVFDGKTGLRYSGSGISLLFLSVFAAVVYGFLIKKLMQNYTPITIVRWQNSLGAIFFFPLALGIEWEHTLAVRPDVRFWFHFFALTITASTLAFLLYNTAIKSVGVIRAGVFVNLIPVVTALFSYLLLDEIFPSHKVLGMVLVIGGVVMAQGWQAFHQNNFSS